MTYLKKLQKEQSSPKSMDLQNTKLTTSHALLMENVRTWEDQFINVRTSVGNTLKQVQVSKL